MKTTLVLLPHTSLLVTSCATAPRPTFDELLSGKTKDGQRDFLRTECLKGRSYRSNNARHSYWSLGDPGLKQAVCNRMADK